MIPEKTFLNLFVLRSVQGVAGYFHFGFALVTMSPETIATTYDEGDDNAQLQVEQEYRGVDPAVREILQFRVFQFYWLI